MIAQPEWISSRVAGIDVDVLTSQVLTHAILSWTNDRVPKVAVGINAHVVNLFASNGDFRRNIQRADIRYADGESIVRASRALGRHMPEKIATTDLIYPLARAGAAEGKRFFFYGGEPGVAAAAAEVLKAAFPDLLISARDGFTGAGSVVDSITRFETDILFVGLGDPLQQTWIDAHRADLRCGAILSCGGLFDWTSGINTRAPAWMIRSGMEWLWRLILEPRRLGSRYLKGNPQFVARVLQQFARERRESGIAARRV